MSAVAVIACDHGLGHVRRSVLNAEALRRAGAEVTLLAPVPAVRRVRAVLGLEGASGVRVLDFATETSPAALRSAAPRTVQWHERLPDLSSFDRVVIDTLPEALERRPDAILVAQFLWHDVITGIEPSIRRRALALAERARLVIGSAPFAMPSVRALPGFREVGLHRREPNERAVDTDALDLLIAGGATDALSDALRTLVDSLVGIGPGPYRNVHVDAALLPADPPPWLRPATHTPAMYDALRAAVVRPGLGTVTELLARGVPIHCVREADNAELAHNAGVIVGLGAGIDHGFPTAALAASLIDERGDPTGNDPTGNARNAASLRFDGADRTADLVLSGSFGSASSPAIGEEESDFRAPR